MPNEFKAGETSEENSLHGSEDPAASEESKEDAVNEVEFTDSNAEDKNSEGTEGKGTQTKEQNSENARRRREAERKRELQSAREQAIIEALNGKNPYTGETMKDAADVNEFLMMREIEKTGGDPISDFPKHQKEKQRKDAEEAERLAKEEEWFKNDRDSFVAKYPEVKLDDLLSDKDFNVFAKGKVGQMPLSEIYEDFVGIVQRYDGKSKKIAAQIVANKKASPGALSTSNGAAGNVYFTREQVQAMSPEEVHKNYEAIRESMTKWK